ncbi:hypothetical protein EYE42_07220 [Paracoccus subflavus]|uniref:t-SNARE coiled-coil homology domain-containing protein n=1 Tax=Paracoccus subflavus TaxID=2528244 RepID=A0A4Q9G2U7_9RHOB|nr:hypothetical protein [Paracoccus subflavus]TBN41161.1 hypothetical protein EYE42_07220 [Paracoccus subflavus]
MELRVRELERSHAVVVERLNGLDRRLDDGFKALSGRFDDVNKQFDNVNKRLDDMGRKIDKLPNEWAMARVVFYVTGALMAAAIFGPRLISTISQ